MVRFPRGTTFEIQALNSQVVILKVMQMQNVMVALTFSCLEIRVKSLFHTSLDVVLQILYMLSKKYIFEMRLQFPCELM